MFHRQSNQNSKLASVVTALLIGTALVLACFAPALSMQKDFYSYDQSSTIRPVTIGYLA